MAWEHLTKPKAQGGLGLGDLRKMNLAFLSKWKWRYSLPQSNEWKSIVQAKYGYCKKSLTLNNEVRGDMSQLWKKIINPFGKNEEWQKVFNEGLSIVVGDGKATKFWHDSWINGHSLKDVYPRIYALSLDKDNFISDLGRWVNDRWVWEINLRRKVFDLEVDVWNNFNDCIKAQVLQMDKRDSLIWKLDGNGNFSTKSFIHSLWGNECPSSQAAIWKYWAPPKVIHLSWLVASCKLPTRGYLSKIGVLSKNESFCPFCSVAIETVDHALFWCNRVWRIWSSLLGKFNIYGCMPKRLDDFVPSWKGLMPKGWDIKLWMLIGFGTIWTLWSERNNKIFSNKMLKEEDVLNLLWVRIGRWAHAKWPGKFKSPLDFLMNPLGSLSNVVPGHGSGRVFPIGADGKFSCRVDGAMCLESRAAGIGGCVERSYG